LLYLWLICPLHSQPRRDAMIWSQRTHSVSCLFQNVDYQHVQWIILPFVWMSINYSLLLWRKSINQSFKGFPWCVLLSQKSGNYFRVQ
jgi:hypothetical protein